VIFVEAVDKGYVIVVKNNEIACQLKRKFKRGCFATINSSPYRFDGCNGIYIDEQIQLEPKASELNKYHFNIEFGQIPNI
jgi:hypothetical protein